MNELISCFALWIMVKSCFQDCVRHEGNSEKASEFRISDENLLRCYGRH